MKTKIKTLISVTQKGAHRFVSLLGKPADVQRDVNNLYNTGIAQEIPEEYRDGQDGHCTLVTSEYRLLKVAKATALSDIAAKGRRAGGKMKENIENKTAKILKHLKEVFASEKCPFGTGEAQEFAIGAHGRAGRWEE